MKVNFYDVGRGLKKWTASCPTEITLDWLHSQVKLFGGLSASSIGFLTVHGKGTIYDGDRPVGNYEIVTETITNKGGGGNG
ncbi:MAG: hypothetical protein FWE91_09765 [Defluviitaleaceae bacterium]|nr:hypothetical protein [Defluviitaleaceae bacterium]